MKGIVTFLIILLVSVLAFASCGRPAPLAPTEMPTSPQPKESWTVEGKGEAIAKEPTPTPTPIPTPVLPVPTPTPTSIAPTSTPTPLAPTPTPIPTPPTTIPIIEVEWKNIGPNGVRVDDVYVDPADWYALYAAKRISWTETGVWRSSDGGNFWENLGKRVVKLSPPDEKGEMESEYVSGPSIPVGLQYILNREERDYWHEQFIKRIIPQMERNPTFLPQITGKMSASQAGLEYLVKDGNILFAAIIDMGFNVDERLPARKERRYLVSTNGGDSWMELVPPRPMPAADYSPSLAIIRKEEKTFIYLADASQGILWKAATPSD